MDEKPTVKVKFGIPNTMCRYYKDMMECGHDEKPHTCCEEECTLPEILFGFKERTMEVNHKFEDSICTHCGDPESKAEQVI